MAMFGQDVGHDVDVIRFATATLTGAWVFSVGDIGLNGVRASRVLTVRHMPAISTSAKNGRAREADSASAPTVGRSYPLGPTLIPGGANFSVFSKGASAIELFLCDRVDDAGPSRVIPIDPLTN